MDENNEEKNLEQKEMQNEVHNNAKVEDKNETRGFGIASMVLGIISIIVCCIPYISLPCAALAIIFALVGMKKPGKGMGIAGLVLGIITIMLYLLTIFGVVSIFNWVSKGSTEQAVRDLENTIRFLETLQ